MKYSLRNRVKDKQIQWCLWLARLLAKMANWFNDRSEALIESELHVMSDEIKAAMKRVDREESQANLH